MLDQLLSKCVSLAHFNSILGFVDQVASALKGSFGGPLEQELASIIASLIEANMQTPVNAPITPPANPTSDVVSKPIQS